MGTFSIWHWLIVLVVVLVLFGGRGKLSGLMGDMAKGIKAFKSGMKEEPTATPKQIDETESAETIETVETVEAAETADTTVNKEKAAEG